MEKRRVMSTGVIKSEETRKKLSISHNGKKLSEETKKKISLAHRKRIENMKNKGKEIEKNNN